MIISQREAKLNSKCAQCLMPVHRRAACKLLPTNKDYFKQKIVKVVLETVRTAK